MIEFIYERALLINTIQLALVIIFQQMCGRIYQTLPLHRLISIARARMATNPESYQASFNVCPTTFIPAIRSNKRFLSINPSQKQKQEEDKLNKPIQQQEVKQDQQPNKTPNNQLQPQSTQNDDYQLGFSKWGIKTKHNFIINARSEEMFMKPTFTKIIQNRCVVIMQGYFEWNTKKDPFLFKSKKTDHLLAAGLYNQDNEVVILTRDAVSHLKEVHTRMPVILSTEEVKQWLDPQNNDVISKIVEQCFLTSDKPVWEDIQITKLAPYVNSIKQKSIKCLMSYEDYKKELDKNGIMRFFKKKQPVVDVVGMDGQILTMTESKKKNLSDDEESDGKQQLKMKTSDLSDGKHFESTNEKSQKKRQQ